MRLIFLCFILLLIGCSDQGDQLLTDNQEIKVGGIYTSQTDEGNWKVTRVLALDDFAVHVRFYSDTFETRPEDVEISDLKWIIGHAPLAIDGFNAEDRYLIKVEPVQDEELDGYRYYLESTGQ